MSAIAGFWALDERADADLRCRAMLDALSLYGPDDVAIGRLGPAALGRALFRLLPEDVADRQPIRAGGGRIALVADVRLDNRGELAAALGLAPGEAARLADSALVGAAVERWGAEGAATRLLGDFAFAAFEPEARRLVLARDPLGQRPLFLARGPGFIAFASMPRGLHALPEVERRPDGEEVARFLALFPRRGEESYFAGLRRVEPGHVVILEAERETASRYWNPSREPLRLPRFAD
jgi:asparagine synthase (glutamine-hydrolysing)